MWFTLFRIGMFIGSIIYQQLTKPEIKKPKASKDTSNFPRSKEGDGISVIFGYAYIEDAELVWYKLQTALRTPNTNQTGEFVYFAAAQEVICLSNIDSIEFLFIDGNANRCNWDSDTADPVYSGWSTNTENIPVGRSYTSLGTNKYNYDDPAGFLDLDLSDMVEFLEGFYEGLSISFVSLEFGGATQPENTFLSQVGQQAGVNPAYRGVVQAVWPSKVVSISATPSFNYVPQYLVKRIALQHDGTAQWYSAKSHTGYGLNVIHCIRELIISNAIGAGLSDTFIDSVSFEAAADTCYTEGIGLSFHYNNTDGTVKDLVEDLMNYAVGFLYFDIQNLVFKIKLFRNDYVYASLDEITVSSAYTISNITKKDNAEVVNDVTVTYRDRYTFKPKAAKYSDSASILSIGINPQNIDFEKCMNADYAAKIAAQTVLFSIANPSGLTLSGPLGLDKYNPGDVFKLTDPRYGWDGIVVRVLEKKRSRVDSEKIELSLIEDLFGIGESSFGTGNGNPVYPVLVDVLNPIVKEMPYFMNRQAYDDPDLSIGEGFALVFAMCSLSTGNTSFGSYYKLSTDPAYTFSGTGNPFIAIRTLDANIGLTDTAIVTDEGTLPSGYFKYIIIDDEIMGSYSTNPATGTISAHRGLHDTLPAAHTAGAIIYFLVLPTGSYDFETGRNYDIIETLLANGSQYNIRLNAEAWNGVQIATDAPQVDITIANRSIRPINAGGFKINGYSYEDDGILWIGFDAGTPITWLHRNRVLYWNTLTTQATTGQTKETGVLYCVEIWDSADANLIRTEDLINDDEYDYTTALEITDFSGLTDKIIKLKSKRLKANLIDYWESWQEWSIPVKRLTAPAGEFIEAGGLTVCNITNNTDYTAEKWYYEYTTAAEPSEPAEPSDPTTGSSFGTSPILVIPVLGTNMNVWVKARGYKNGALSILLSIKNY